MGQKECVAFIILFSVDGWMDGWMDGRTDDWLLELLVLYILFYIDISKVTLNISAD